MVDDYDGLTRMAVGYLRALGEEPSARQLVEEKSWKIFIEAAMGRISPDKAIELQQELHGSSDLSKR
ncbi:hypothetical protein A2W24_06920 [Microgenomates group bacterium RBG_16_45_19]|nr:MAG: hypothetical protein A2W24_06920 [Microgenomates group bacterium RBG_16_45_19]